MSSYIVAHFKIRLSPLSFCTLCTTQYSTRPRIHCYYCYSVDFFVVVVAFRHPFGFNLYIPRELYIFIIGQWVETPKSMECTIKYTCTMHVILWTERAVDGVVTDLSILKLERLTNTVWRKTTTTTTMCSVPAACARQQRLFKFNWNILSRDRIRTLDIK